MDGYEDPYTELAGTINAFSVLVDTLKDEIVELQSVIIDLIRAVKTNSDELEANTAELMQQ